MALEITVERDEFVDWEGRKAEPTKHGGIRAASFACVVEILENMVFLSNATNFVMYFKSSMNYATAEAANMVTNFMGTSFLLTILGGFISDSFFTRFWSFIIFCTIELLGLIMLTVQAQYPRFQPVGGRRPSNLQAVVLYTGLYSIATGVGGVKASLPTHGADQLDHTNQRLMSGFFNWFFFSLCTGGLIAATVMVWIEENKGWRWSFVILVVALSLALCIFVMGFKLYRYKLPTGSPLTRIFEVFVSAVRNKKASSVEILGQNGLSRRSNDKFRFLNKALVDDRISLAQVEETKTFLGLLPIFASTIMMNSCLAQLQTFTVQQGNIMNKSINHNFEIPTPSLSVFPLVIMLASIPLYERLATIFRSKNNLFRPLRRIGLGLVLASGAMVVAAAVEVKRRGAIENNKVTLSVFWLIWQYLLLGISDMLTLGGMLEFFYLEAPDSMRSICTALSWCSMSMGYFLSSGLVWITNSVSQHFGGEWLGGNNLNHNRLDLFYTLLAFLNFLSFINYVYWAKRY